MIDAEKITFQEKITVMQMLNNITTMLIIFRDTIFPPLIHQETVSCLLNPL